MHGLLVALAQLGELLFLFGDNPLLPAHSGQDKLPSGRPQGALLQLEPCNLQVFLEYGQDGLEVDAHLVRQLVEGHYLARYLAIPTFSVALGVAVGAEDVPATRNPKGIRIILEALIAKRFQVHFFKRK